MSLVDDLMIQRAQAALVDPTSHPDTRDAARKLLEGRTELDAARLEREAGRDQSAACALGMPAIRGGAGGVKLGHIVMPIADEDLPVQCANLRSLVLAPGELDRLARMVGVAIGPTDEDTICRIEASTGVRRWQAHGRPAPLSASSGELSCGYEGADLTPTDEELLDDLRSDIGRAVLDAIEPFEVEGRVPYTSDSREAITRAIVDVLGNAGRLAPLVAITITITIDDPPDPKAYYAATTLAAELGPSFAGHTNGDIVGEVAREIRGAR